MNRKINTICVFASSSNNIDSKYFLEATKLGVEIANNHYNIVYGGSNLGLMGEVTRSAMSRGSEITGVMPEKLYNLGINPGDCTKFILTKGMRERKAKMDELSNGVIALPGGFGTLEELSEMVVQKQLGYNNKPIVLLNSYGFYDNLIKFFDEIIEKNFASNNSKNIYFAAKTPTEALLYINNYDFSTIDYLGGKIGLEVKN